MLFYQPKISLKLAEQFCGRFGVALKAGIDPLRLLQSEAKIGTARHQTAANEIRERLIAGDTLSEAMQTRRDYFPWLLTQMVDAGEHAGRLDRTFAYMSHYYRDLRETRASFIKQITWPAIQIVIAIAIVSLLIWLMGMIFNDGANTGYDPLGFGLKGVPGVLTFWGYITIVAILLGVVVRAIWKDWFGLHAILMPIFINVPIIGGVLKYVALSRLTMVLSLLLNSGVDAIRAVQMAFRSTGNNYYIRQMPKSVGAVKKGETLSKSFASSGVMPQEFIDAVEVGELSGSETESLDALARDYEVRAKSALQQMSVAASTAIWLAIAGMIVFLIFRIAMNYINMLQDVANGKF